MKQQNKVFELLTTSSVYWCVKESHTKWSINLANALTLHANKILSVQNQEEIQDKQEGYVKKGIWCKICLDSLWGPVGKYGRNPFNISRCTILQIHIS